MIHNKDILEIIHDTYQLSGSRLIASRNDGIVVINKETDYDFCVEDSTAARQNLLSLGFSFEELTPVPEYMDASAKCIAYRKCIYFEIQVVLREDCKGWMKSINSLTSVFYRDYVWKSGPNKPQKQQIKEILNQIYITSKS